MRLSHVIATGWLLLAVVASGAILSAWLMTAIVVAIWAAIVTFAAWRSWPWAAVLRVRRVANVLFGERYADDIDLLEDDAMSILEAARNVHNWGSRNAAAVAGLGTVLALWFAPERWEPFAGLLGLVAIVAATHYPAIRRRIEMWRAGE